MMNKKTLVFLAALFGAIATAGAQTPNILTVDMVQVFQEYEQAKSALDTLRSAVQTEQDEINRKMEEGQGLVDERNEAIARSNNLALTEEAREAARQEAEELGQQIEQKQVEVAQFRQRTQQMLQERRQKIISYQMDQISQVVIEMAQRRGASLVINSANRNVVYADSSMDITDDVISTLNESAGDGEEAS